MKMRIVVIFLLATLGLHSLEWETTMSGSGGKRFYDDYDAHFSNIRTDETGMKNASVRYSSHLRNYYSADFSVLISPFFRHYIGLSGKYSWYPQALNQYMLDGKTYQWLADLSVVEPAIVYHYYVMPGFLFLRGTIGLNLGYLQYTVFTTSGTDLYSFAPMIGFQSSVGLFAHLKKWGNVSITGGGSVQFGLLDNPEGTGPDGDFTLRKKDGYLVPLVVDSSSNGFEKTALWLNGLEFRLGIMYRR